MSAAVVPERRCDDCPYSQAARLDRARINLAEQIELDCFPHMLELVPTREEVDHADR